MAELTISADDIQNAIEEYVSSFTADTSREEVGTVMDAGDGIAHVEGLPSVMTQELLEFPGGVLGDYFGVNSGGGYTYTTSISTFNYAAENGSFHQQQVVARIPTP